MFVKNFAILCCGFLIIISSSKSQQNYTNNEEKSHNLTVRYEVDTNSTAVYSGEIKTLRYDLYEKFANNAQYNEMEYEFRTISTNNDRKDVDLIIHKLRSHSVHNYENDEKIPKISQTNSTNVNNKKNFTSQEVYENLIQKNDSMSNEVFENSNKSINGSNIIPFKMCHNITCILLCCPLGNSMKWDGTECIPEDIEYVFPNVYEYMNDSMQNESKRVNEIFHLAVYNSCLETQRFVVDGGYQYDYKIFTNGSIYLSYYKTLFKSTSYCLAVSLNKGKKFEVIFCPPEYSMGNDKEKIYAILELVCLLFLMPIFLVYSILPELRNIHGFMLCNYSFTSFVALIFKTVKFIIYIKMEVSYPVCIILAFLEYFFLVSMYFWLITMSFYMWRTFREFSSLRRDIGQSGKKRLAYYVIFAYGCPFILAIVCVIIVEFVSKYIPKIWRPELEKGNCWFNAENKGAYVLYFYWIKTTCTISSVCLSISTALNIKRYEKDADFHLTDSESKRYNDNKIWFHLYMKLFMLMFIMMGINWSVLTTSWWFAFLTDYYYYITCVSGLLDVVQSFCTFIIFVWKKKIKFMLLKRFGFDTTRKIDLNTISKESMRTSQTFVKTKTVTRQIRLMGSNSNVTVC